MRITTILGHGFVQDTGFAGPGGPLKVIYARARHLESGWLLDAVEVVEEDGGWKIQQEHLIQQNVKTGTVASMLLAWQEAMATARGMPAIEPQRFSSDYPSWLSLESLRGMERSEQKRILEGQNGPEKSKIVSPEIADRIDQAVQRSEPNGGTVSPTASAHRPSSAIQSIYPPDLGPQGRRVHGLGLICQMVGNKTKNAKEARLLKIAQYTLMRLAQDEGMSEMLQEYALKCLEDEEKARSETKACGSSCSHHHHGHDHDHGHEHDPGRTRQASAVPDTDENC